MNQTQLTVVDPTIKINKTVFIYSLSGPDRQVRYVGKTIHMANRLREHFKCKNPTYSSMWIKHLLRLGHEPKMEVLEETDEENWSDAERFWIGYLSFLGCRLTNLDSGGRFGKERHLETKAKISQTVSRGVADGERMRSHIQKLADMKRGKPQPWAKKRMASGDFHDSSKQSKRAKNRWLKRYPNGCPTPWIELGISRSTWRRRNKQAAHLIASGEREEINP